MSSPEENRYVLPSPGRWLITPQLFLQMNRPEIWTRPTGMRSWIYLSASQAVGMDGRESADFHEPKCLLLAYPLIVRVRVSDFVLRAPIAQACSDGLRAARPNSSCVSPHDFR